MNGKLDTSTACYLTVADKNGRFPREIIAQYQALFQKSVGSPPALAGQVRLFAEYLEPARLRPYTSPRLLWGDEGALLRLHELVRQGRYIFNPAWPCDRVQPAELTIANGGDCDQWSLVLALAAYLMGYPRCYFMTAGFPEPADKFAHVYVVVEGSPVMGKRKAWTLDPKGDQQGADFNVEPANFPLRQGWHYYQADDRPKGRI